MSVHNLQGAPFAILNEKGHYELFDKNGSKIEMLATTIRITQRADSLDQIMIVGVVNVMTSKEEMQKQLLEWQTK